MIVICVRWYLQFCRSFRDLEELAQHGGAARHRHADRVRGQVCRSPPRLFGGEARYTISAPFQLPPAPDKVEGQTDIGKQKPHAET